MTRNRTAKKRARTAPVCAVCRLEDDTREEIDWALALDRLTQAEVARRYGLDRSAVWRHRQKHLPDRLAEVFANDDRADVSLDSLARQISETLEGLRVIMHRAEDQWQFGEYDGWLKAAEQQRRSVDTLARLLGLVHDRIEVTGTIRLEASDEWRQLSARIVTALEAHPQARLAVVDAISDTEAP